MKKVILSFLLLSISLVKAQGDNQQWQFGVNFMPFLYWKKNNFIQSSPHIQVQPIKKINGVYGGLFTEKYFNKNWGIRLSLNYSKQNYENRSVIIPRDINGWVLDDPNIYYRIVSENNFYYFSIPITAQFAYPLDDSQNLFLVGGAGPQVSIFSRFSVNKYSVDTDGSYETNSPNYYFSKQDVYRKILVGAVAYTGIKFKISDAFNGFTNIRYEYDFSNASKNNWTIENNPYEFGQLEATDPTLPYTKVNASKSHNMRLGLEFGIVYDFR